MKRKLFHITFMLAVLISLRATAESYEGYIFDKTTGLPLSFAHICDNSGKMICQSDEEGRFFIEKINNDSLRLRASYVGYTLYEMSFTAKSSELLIAMSPESQKLNDVEVTALRSAININKQYAQTSVYDTRIEENISTSLIDILETVPGLYKKAEYHSPIVLRGLSGKRLLITLDGNRRMGSTSAGFTGQTVNIFDLEKIDVIKGPASVRYGPGAIAGIINMVRRSPFGSKGINGKVLTTYGENNNEYSALANISYNLGNAAFGIGGRYMTAEDMRYGNSERAFNSNHTDKDISAFLALRKNESFSLTAEGNIHLGGPWGRAKGYNGTDYVLQTTEKDDNYHCSMTGIWKSDGFIKQADLSVYFDKDRMRDIRNDYDIASGRLSYSEDVSYDNYYSGWRMHAMTQLSTRSLLTVGTDGVFYRVDSPTVLTDYFKNFTISNRVAEDAGLFMGGVFAETETDIINERLKWIAGVRGDIANINEGNVHDTLSEKGRHEYIHAFNISTGLIYTPVEDLFISFNIARACRMPDATELFVETATTDGLVFGNADLKPEYGMNLDFGIRGGIGGVTFDISTFSNFLYDFIRRKVWKSAAKKGMNYRYENMEKSIIYGAEVSLGYNRKGIFSEKDNISYNGFAVWTKGYELKKDQKWFSREGIPLNNIPPFNTRHELTYRYRIGYRSSVYAGLNFLLFDGRTEYAPNSYPTGAYSLLGCQGGIKKRYKGCDYKFSVSVNNLTNEVYRPFESLIYGMGRNFKFMVAVEFGGKNDTYRRNAANCIFPP